MEGLVSVLRGVRGATTAEANDLEPIISRVVELLNVLQGQNSINLEDIAAVIFSSTPDLTAAFPAVAARRLGWNEVPLFGTQEIDNPQAVPKCIRVLILWNTNMDQAAIKHSYLHGAAVLRPDLSSK
jgi:chorismate mutase